MDVEDVTAMASFGRAKPVEVGQEYDVSIPTTSERGDGITRIQGFVIFVAGAIAGEHLRIKVVEVGNWFDNAQAVSRSSEGKREKEGRTG